SDECSELGYGSRLIESGDQSIAIRKTDLDLSHRLALIHSERSLSSLQCRFRVFLGYKRRDIVNDLRNDCSQSGTRSTKENHLGRFVVARHSDHLHIDFLSRILQRQFTGNSASCDVVEESGIGGIVERSQISIIELESILVSSHRDWDRSRLRSGGSIDSLCATNVISQSMATSCEGERRRRITIQSTFVHFGSSISSCLEEFICDFPFVLSRSRTNNLLATVLASSHEERLLFSIRFLPRISTFRAICIIIYNANAESPRLTHSTPRHKS
ncbi:hypothetical protein PENTCL1PPCAC_17994, partial [Pristionchus entomophagus]